MSIPASRLMIVAASSLVAVASLTLPAAQAVTCQAWNTASGGAASADLQAVIDAAAPGDTIHVAGTCSGGFTIDKDLTVARAPGADLAVLDGGGRTRVLAIIGVAPSTIAVTLKGLRITRGLGDPDGGGIMMRRAAVRLMSTLVDHNRTKDGVGGGIYISDAFRSLLVLGGSTTVRENHARGHRPGGGIYTDGVVRLHASATIAQNFAVNGGGIYAYRVAMQDTSRVVRNSAGSRGGGIYAYQVVMLDRAEVNHNTSRRGGGIQLGQCSNPRKCSLRMQGRSRLSSNVAERGGGVYSYGGVFLRDHASIVRNKATKTGGGVLSNRLCDSTLLPVSVVEKSMIARNSPNDVVNFVPRYC